MSGLFQTRNITCGCGRDMRVPVLGDVYSLTREAIEQEARQEAELLMKSAIDDATRVRAALENVRLLAARNRTEDWAQHMLRFCESAGVVGSPLRGE